MESKAGPALRQITVALGLTGLLAGFILAISILSGDAQGRVNLLYLLVLFVFLPVLGLLLSLVFLLRKSSHGLAGWALELPLWPDRLRHEVIALGTGRTRKYWLFYQTQLMALTFAVGGLIAFVLLLLGSDISFVWRSTLLNATDLQPLLEVLAWPWTFWPGAQPSLQLLQQSQDFRLATPEFTAELLGQWWQYAIAALCTYSLLPRLCMALVSRAIYRSSVKQDPLATDMDIVHINALNTVPMQGDLAPLVNTMPRDYVLVDWARVPADLVVELVRSIGRPQEIIRADPLTELDKEQVARLAGKVPVLIVRAWEPPMGELHDFLVDMKHKFDSPGLLLPVDWNGKALRPVRGNDMQEWQRFCGTLNGWSVLRVKPGERL